MSKPNKRPENTYHMTTRLIHGRDFSAHWEYRHHLIPPITASSAFKLDSTKRGAQGFLEFDQPGRDTQNQPPIYIYDRLDEPTVGMLEEYLATAEQGKFALCFASGMGAIASTLLTLLKAGDSIVAHKTLYGCSYSLMTNWLPRYQIRSRFVDLRDLNDLESRLQANTRVIYLETPANPTLDIIDLPALAAAIKACNQRRSSEQQIYLVVDNTFATPYCQRPLTLGADLVLHSLTKNICGFGTDMGGAVVTDGRFDSELRLARKDFGAVLSARSAWNVLVYGVGTLPTRIEQQMRSALKVAQYLEKHPKISRVLYPGLESFSQHTLAKQQMRSPEGAFAPGSIIYFELKGAGQELCKKSERLLDDIAQNAYALTLAVSLGQIRTLIESPGAMTHAAIPAEEQVQAGFDASGIRLSLGLEHVDDIISDLDDALQKI